MNINHEIVNLILNAEKAVAQEHKGIDEITLFNQAKVLRAFQEERITDDCFANTDGYGYNDLGREKIEALFANIFKGEDALVTPNFVSGTHTLFTGLKGLLRPGDRLLSLTGTPYETLHRCISGNGEKGEGTLTDWGISYAQLELGEKLQENRAVQLIKEPTKVIFIQRSKGYNPYRDSLTIEEISSLIKHVRELNPGAIVFVDNCYGEFVQEKEPLEVGADVVAGSFIKNPGGGLAPTGGYIVGKEKYISKICSAYSAPGLGKELGAFDNKKLFYQGTFMAPHIVGEALKGAVTTAQAFQSLGYKVKPEAGTKRADIVQAIHLNGESEVQRICHAVQQSSPVNSHLIPEASPTAGYSLPIFMAAGTFVQGSSIEFSADSPLNAPYRVYLQGGLSYQHIKLGLASVLTQLQKDK